MKSLRPALLLALLLAPGLAFAAPSFSGLVDNVLSLINLIIPLLASVAIVIFLWGIVRYIASAEDSEAHAKGRELIIWGAVALFVMFSVWGLVGILRATFLNGA